MRYRLMSVLLIVAFFGLSPIHQMAESVAGGQSIGDPFAPELGNTGYDVTHYDLALRFDLDKGTLDGIATLDAKATIDQLGSLSLDFSTLTANDVTIDGETVKFEQGADTQKLMITLPKPLAAGTVFKISVVYGGTPKPFTSRYVPFTQIGLFIDTTLRQAFALNEPDGAHSWFPCNDHPRDRATYMFHVTVDGALTAVANGQQQGEPITNTDGTRTFNWNMPQNMATYLATVAIDRYEALPLPGSSPIPLAVYAYPEDQPLVLKAFPETAALLQFEIETFGAFPFASYGQVLVAVRDVGMETQTMTTLPYNVLSGTADTNRGLIAHEMAHQWFGDAVSLSSWAEIWLNEGFASYAEYLVEEKFGSKQAANEDVLRVWEQAFIPQLADEAPIVAPIPADMFGNNSYLKAGFVLHMLRQEIGDDAFFKTLQTYIAQYRDRNASTADFEAVAETVSGKSLTTFFDQWLRRAGLPRLNILWTEKDGQIDALVCQSANQKPYTLTLPIELQGDPATAANKADDENIALTAVETHVHLSPGFDVAKWQIDPNQHVLEKTTTKRVDTLPASCS